MVFPIKVELLRDDPKWLARHLALDRPVQDIVGDTVDRVGELLSRDDLGRGGEGSLVVAPRESLSECRIFRQGEVLLSQGFIVSEGRDGAREELPPLAERPHMLDDPRDERLVLLTRVLAIEDTVFFLLETDTPEAVATAMAKVRVPQVMAPAPARVAKSACGRALASHDFETEGAAIPREAIIVGVGEGHGVEAVPYIVALERVK